MKKLLLVIALILPLTIFAQVTEWNFNTAGNLEGWQQKVMHTFEVNNGSLKLSDFLPKDAQTTTSSPRIYYVYSAATNLNSSKYVTIRIRNNTPDSKCRFFFFSAALTGGFSYVDFTISTNDTGFNEYTIDLSANADWATAKTSITQFRFDLPFPATVINSTAVFVLVDYVKVLTTLPVSLIKFDTQASASGAAKLTWLTSNEVNNSYYKIERSDNGKDFVEVGKIDAKFNNDATKAYSFTDNSSLAGVSYYRLSQFDNDGKNEILGVKTFKNTLSDQVTKVFPNPITQGKFSVSLSEEAKSPFTVEVFNLKGQSVFVKEIKDLNKSVYEIDMGNITPGTYILKTGTVSKSILVL